jgi:hypothetical protein
MPLFKLAKTRTIAEIAAHLARLKREEKDLRYTLKHNPHHHGARTARNITLAQIDFTKRERGVPKRAGMRTVKKQRGCRRGRRR